MKITGFGVLPAKAEKTKNTKRTTSSKASSGTKSAGDSVEVADHAQTLEVIKELVAGEADVRLDEVERIVNQLKNGKYKINFEKVAEGFIKEAILTEIARKPRVGSKK